MDRILKTDPDFPISDSRKIADTRNRVIHGYDSVSEDIIWLFVSKYLPILEKEIKEFYNNTPSLFCFLLVSQATYLDFLHLPLTNK